MNNWLNIIQKICLPPRCLFCGQPGFDDLDICQACFADLAANHACCYRCGQHFDMPIATPQLCGRCLKKSPSFDETFAPFLYDDHLRFLITHLKFNQRYKHARLLGSLLARHLAVCAEFPDRIIPVPLHHRRYRERGFNQSIEIARHLAEQLEVKLDLGSCVRQRNTAHQTGLPAKQRQKNMRQAFSVVKPFAGQHVAIVDDVMTTGATASALADALKRHGASRVDVWVCARA